MSILKKHVAHPVALLAAIATLASGLTCMTNPVASPKAHADELKPAYATAKIVKKADGTGAWHEFANVRELEERVRHGR